MTIEQFIAENPNATNAEIATAYNAHPAGWKMVSSASFLAWLGVNARYAKLEAVADSTSNDPQSIAIRSAVKTVLIAASNPDAELWLAPGSEPRQFLSAMVSIGVLTTDDAAALLERAMTRPPTTESAVADVRNRMTQLATIEAVYQAAMTVAESNRETAIAAYNTAVAAAGQAKVDAIAAMEAE